MDHSSQIGLVAADRGVVGRLGLAAGRGARRPRGVPPPGPGAGAGGHADRDAQGAPRGAARAGRRAGGAAARGGEGARGDPDGAAARPGRRLRVGGRAGGPARVVHADLGEVSGADDLRTLALEVRGRSARSRRWSPWPAWRTGVRSWWSRPTRRRASAGLRRGRAGEGRRDRAGRRRRRQARRRAGRRHGPGARCLGPASALRDAVAGPLSAVTVQRGARLGVDVGACGSASRRATRTGSSRRPWRRCRGRPGRRRRGADRGDRARARCGVCVRRAARHLSGREGSHPRPRATMVCTWHVPSRRFPSASSTSG